MKRKILFSIIILTVAFSVGIALKTKAGVGDSGTGWLWGGSDDGASSLTGISWISMNDTNTGVGSYGINIPAGDGSVTGYAWSGGGDDGVGVGWIDFEPQTHCGVNYSAASCTDPDGGTGGVSRSSDSLIGWARIVGIAEASATVNSGGWEGWIKMSGTAQDTNPYGVTIESDGSFCKAGDLTTFEVSGDGLDHCAAWSGGVASAELGFIDFRQASTGPATKTLKICESDCIAGALLPNTITMIEGNSKNLKACYDIASDCTGGGDETVASAWAEVVDGSDVISLIDTDSSPETLNSNMVAADGTATFSVDYNDAGVHHIVTIAVDVTDVPAPVCPNGIVEGAEECDDGAAGNGPCPAACSVTCTLNDCSVGSSWKEVAP